LTQAQVTARYQGQAPTKVAPGHVVSQWGFLDGSGSTLTDQQGNANFTLTGSPTWKTDTPSKTRSPVSTARSLVSVPRQLYSGPPGVVTIAQADGTSNSIISAGSSSGYASVSALSCWFLCPPVSTAAVGYCPVLVGDTAADSYLFLQVNSANLRVVGARSSSNFVSHYIGSANQYTGAWHHAAVTTSASGLTVWIDGVVAYTTGVDCHLTMGSAPTIYFCGAGGAYANTWPATGLIAVVGAYSSLSQADVTALYQGALPSTRSGHIASWAMRDPVGSTSLSVTGSGNNATLGSTTVLL
jgi:hypothetical protein